MRYTEIAVVVEADDAPRAAEVLLDEGVAVEERDGTTLLRSEPGCAMLLAYSAPESADVEAARIAAALRGAGIATRTFLRERDEEGWLDAWKAYFQPREVGPFAIVPSFSTEFRPQRAECIIRLDPGRAFGTGGHASTRACLEAIGRLPPRRRVLDVGCGSGILAIASLLRWPDATATAIDLDLEAVEVTSENAVLNAVADRIAASSQLLASISDRFDLVVGNLTADILDELAPDLVGHVADGGRLVVGGFIVEQALAVEERLRGCGAGVPLTIVDEEWCSMVFERSG